MGARGLRGGQAALALSDAGGEGCALEGLSTTREKRRGGEDGEGRSEEGRKRKEAVAG